MDTDTNNLRARRIVAAAAREGGIAGRVIAGAVNDIWERTTVGLLDATRDRAAALGMTEEQVDAELVVALRVTAVEIAVRSLAMLPGTTPPSSPRKVS